MNTPNLAHLMGAYYHQDFDVYDGTLWGPLTAFVLDCARADLVALLSEIADVLQRLPTEQELEDLLVSLNAEVYLAEEPGGYRGWLEEIARRVEASLAG